MSGSGSGGRTPSAPSNPCDQLSFFSVITSPQPAVIGQLGVGAVLNVALQATPQTAIVVDYNGAVAGALTGTKITNLISCLQNGYDFTAEVISIVGGKCTVRVKAK